MDKGKGMRTGRTNLASKRAAAAFLILTLGYALTAARTTGSPPTMQDKRAARRTAAQTLEQGREVYIQNCARCHGGDGLGKTRLGLSVEAPDMTDPRWQSRRSRRRMTQSVVKGRGQMPAFAGKLTRDEIASAIAYVRALKR
jgi:cytochrome c oxidase cbb3-type subunit 3